MIGYIWARQSNKYDKAVYSLESQLDACREAAKRDGIDVTPEREYVVKFSGVDLWKIPELTQLRGAIERTSGPKRVYCYAQDRLIRGEEGPEIFWLVYEFKRYGAEVKIILDPVDMTDFAGQIITLFRGHKAAKEPGDIKERTMRGRLKRVKEGKIWNHGLEKFGYTRIKEQGTVIFNEEEKAILEEIISRVFAGDSAYSIAKRLNSQNIAPPWRRRGMIIKGKLTEGVWRHGTITGMLRDPAYKGEAAAMRYKNGSKGRTPESEWIIIPDVYPALLTPERWDELQIKLSEIAAKKYRTRNGTHPLLFRGHVICAKCSQRMTVCVRPYTLKNGEKRKCWFYACKKQDRDGKLICSPWNQVSARRLEEEGWNAVIQAFTPEALERYTQRRKTPPEAGNAERRRVLEEARSKKETQQQNLITKLSEAGESTGKAILRRLEDLAEEIKNLDKQIQQLKQTAAEADRRSRETASLFTNLSRLAPRLGALDFAGKRKILEAFEVQAIWNRESRNLTIDIPLLRDYTVLDSSSSRTVQKYISEQMG